MAELKGFTMTDLRSERLELAYNTGAGAREDFAALFKIKYDPASSSSVENLRARLDAIGQKYTGSKLAIGGISNICKWFKPCNDLEKAQYAAHLLLNSLYQSIKTAASLQVRSVDL